MTTVSLAPHWAKYVDILIFRLQDHARYQTLKELEAVKSIRKEGGNEEEWTVEGFGNCTKSPSAAELKPSVRFNDDENSSLSEGRISEKISTGTRSGEEYRSNRSSSKQSSRLQSEKERAR